MKSRSTITRTERRKLPAKGGNSAKLGVPEQHQLRIARQTLRMPDEMVGVMGGPNKAEARAIIKRLTGKESKE